jgi:lysozyme
VSYNREKLGNELGRDEGEKFRWYFCTAHKRTIGIGRNLDDVGISAAETRQLGITLASVLANGITREQSRALFANDIARCEADLDRALPWWRRLDDVRQRVLLNMCFNLGIKGLLGFKNTLGMVERGDFKGAARGMANSLWHNQVGARALRLEAMMATGKDAA